MSETGGEEGATLKFGFLCSAGNRFRPNFRAWFKMAVTNIQQNTIFEINLRVCILYVFIYESLLQPDGIFHYYLGEFVGRLCTENRNFLLAEMEMTSELQGFVHSGTDDVNK